MTYDFTLISALSIIAPLIAGAIAFRRLDFSLRLIVVMIFLVALGELAASILFESKVNNMFIYHAHTYVEFYFLIIFYYRLFRRRFSQKIAEVFAIAFLVISCLLYLRDSIYEFNSAQRYVEMILLIFIMYQFLYELDKFSSRVRILKSPFFWLTVGYVIYFAGTLLLFLLQQKFVESGFNGYWVVHGIFNIFLNLVLTFVLWTGRERYS